MPEFRGTYDDEVGDGDNEVHDDWFAADWEPRDEIRDLFETDIDLQLSQQGRKVVIARNFGELLENGQFVAYAPLIYHRRISDFKFEFWAVADRHNELTDLSEKAQKQKFEEITSNIGASSITGSSSLIVPKVSDG